MGPLPRLAAVSFVAMLCTLPWQSVARAQAVFVEGTAFAGIERRNTVRSASLDSGFSQDMSGIVAGGSVGVGVGLTPHVSVRFEVGWPAALEKTTELASPIPAVGIRLPYPDYRFASEVSDRPRTFSPLITWHTARRHGIQLGFIGGAAFVARTRRVRDETVYPLFAPEVLATAAGLTLVAPYRTDSTTTQFSVSAQAGLDADIALGSRVSVVPQIRLIGLEDGLSIRPGVGVRVHF